MYIIKNITYKNNNDVFVLNISNNPTIKYNNELYNIDYELVFKYIRSLYSITEDWKEEYINTTEIDGNSWELIIEYSNDTEKVYSGKSSYPDNFDTFEELIYKTLNEVRYVLFKY